MNTNVLFQPATKNDLDSILALNEENIPHVSSMSLELVEYFFAKAEVFEVAKVDDRVVGFVIALSPGLAYQSPNYRWFESRYPSYCYIDRIVVDEDVHGLGLGRQFYDRVIDRIKSKSPHLVCEVNVEPPNPKSMRFHERYGFTEVGMQETDGGKKKVSLLLKDLQFL